MALLTEGGKISRLLLDISRFVMCNSKMELALYDESSRNIHAIQDVLFLLGYSYTHICHPQTDLFRSIRTLQCG